MLKGKRIVLGITGGIAAYKSAQLTRALIKEGAQVKVIMTKSAGEFISPLTFQTLSGNMVYTEMFSPAYQFDIHHIALADFADAFVIAPATGNIIGKIASGIADDLLSTTVMATKKPTLICPAMNDKMLSNPAVQDNISKLKTYGYKVMNSEVGQLACKTEGAGRLPEVDDIIEEIEILLSPKDLQGEKILITAGPTEEPLDPVRFITNSSSGKMGYALARVANRRGAEVTLVTGRTALSPPKVKQTIAVRTAQEMYEAVMENLRNSSVVIKAAAVADYRSQATAKEKIKKSDAVMTVKLKKNPDIISEIGKIKGDRILVGFAMETQNLLANAQEKLNRKNLDLIVANDLRQEGAGFQVDTNIITIIDRQGKSEPLPLMTKIEAAERILDRVIELIAKRESPKKK